jgi:hypothetical protein
MSKKSIFCIATSLDQAEQIVDRLRAAKFSNHDVAVLFLDRSARHDAAHERNTKAPAGAVAGVGTDGGVGGALGWLTGIGALAIRGVGPLIAAGPIIPALNGAAVSGIVGGLIGVGFPELEAKRYEAQVDAGHILISVHSDHWGEIPQAKDIFTKAGAHHVCTAGDTSLKDNLALQRAPHPVEPALSTIRA